MCGRFVLFTTDERLLENVPFATIEMPYGMPKARYNIAPTQVIPVLRPAGGSAEAGAGAGVGVGAGVGGAVVTEMVLEPARWGLIPHWAKELKGPPLFNARAETVASKPSFREAFKRARCAIPMDGYYEWTGEGEAKHPNFIRTGSPIWVAGLYSFGLDQLSATMITTDAQAPLDQVHHRMPRFLAPEEMEQWIFGSPAEATELLTPADPTGFHFTPARKEVGSVRNDYPELMGLELGES